ncbi:hypothetical protein [Alicyclobacillus sp. ALC3]|uniref:hypothetical protein n=1 Tax=Alicyclobacillus sp. ALC3 TaxID=2796143 RepID=UPI002378835C|nr:hypothetical protein [Alicyclobacillus sp. ALC3]WDL99215.1 hypothetical protein JC200_11540 [Alicyclobacillus sp. ALC3]
MNDDLLDRLSVISQIDLSPVDKSDLWHKIQDKMGESRAKRTRHGGKRPSSAVGGIGAAVAGVAIVAVMLTSLHVSTTGSHGTGTFAVAINSNSVTSTPMDTSSFRNTLQKYLERYPLSSNSSSATVPAGSNQALASLPASNKISDLAIRWSQVLDNKYGFAFVTYLANGKPGIADVLALKTGTDKWEVTQLDNTPSTISVSAIAKRFPVYTIEASGGAGFNTNTPAQVSYEFMAGLIVNRSITRVEVVRTGGGGVNVPITNGAFGYVEFGSSGNPIPNGSPTVKAYDNQGHLVYKQ